MGRGVIKRNMDATATIFEDNERVRVTEWRFAVGEETGWHRHELDYTVVPVSTGTLTIVDRSGIETSNSISIGVPYFRYSGAEHNVINQSESPVAFIEIEIK
ncbi:MAG: cupin [Chloroflexi bacterium]|jgi:quercetin dioxygenase-like cupin family protein|nr:cupin [Chloroflexota bacterium]|tara:strand:- start:75 stop:380 length:306 start_codon:yes stop_codon:yes gene_type:complete